MPGQNQRTRVRLLLVVALSGVAGCTASRSDFRPEETIFAAASVHVPIRLVRNLPLVKVSVNGSSPRWFVLDTGAETSIVSKRLAARLDLQREDSGLDILGAGGESIAADAMCRLSKLRIGDAVFQGAHACILDLAHLRSALGESFDGILGYATFAGCVMTLDYAAMEMILSRTSDLADRTTGDVIRVRGYGRLPVVEATVGELPLSLIIDTGSAETFALPDSLRRVLPFRHGPSPGHRGTTIAGSAHRNQIGRLAAGITLGPHFVDEPLVFLTSGPARIGGGVLRFFRLTFDARSGRVRMERTSDAPLTTPGFRSPGFVLRRSGGGWHVADVLPNTPAFAAGLEEGDRVVTINGIPGARLQPSVWSRIRGHGGPIHLVWQRGTERGQMTVEVADVIP